MKWLSKLGKHKKLKEIQIILFRIIFKSIKLPVFEYGERRVRKLKTANFIQSRIAALKQFRLLLTQHYLEFSTWV